MFKLSAAAKKKPRRHNTEVSIRQESSFVMAVSDVQIFLQRKSLLFYWIRKVYGTFIYQPSGKSLFYFFACLTCL